MYFITISNLIVNIILDENMTSHNVEKKDSLIYKIFYICIEFKKELYLRDVK